MGLEETNASEPLMTCRNVFNRRRNRDLDFCPASKGWEMPADRPTGVRHEGGVTSGQASVRNTGTCRPDAKGETQAVSRREGLSTDAGYCPSSEFLGQRAKDLTRNKRIEKVEKKQG